MHETSLAEDMANMVLGHSNGVKVTGVIVEIGTLSGVVPDIFKFCADTVFKEKLNNDIILSIIAIEAKAKCKCGNEFVINDLLDSCPNCNGYTREVISGKDLVLKSIELERE